MAQALPQPTLNTLAGVDARLQAIDKLEALMGEVVREKARHRSNIALKRAVRTWRKGDIVKAGQWALKATEADPDNSKAFHVLAMALERMGHLHKALVTYERAFELDPEDPELLINLGLTAWKLKLTDGATKMFQLYIAACPESPLGYNNLGYAYQHLSQYDKGLAAYDRALELVVDPAERIETTHSRSICLIGLGRIEEGFREYEIRNNERFRCYFHHIIDARRWHGEDVRGKKLLLVGEQGLGDELMFANILPDAQAAVGETGQLQICVDPRMIPLYQRSFP